MSQVLYITKRGDRWDTIAYAAYGNINKMQTIIEANKGVSLTPVFEDGVQLNIPVLEQENIDELNLPPWKR